MKYVCSQCGNENVLRLTWVNPNTNEISSMSAGTEGLCEWCEDCHNTTNIIEAVNSSTSNHKKKQPTKKKKKKYDILSPDGVPIDGEGLYDTIGQLETAYKEWAKRYKHQGYYSSVDYGRIPLNKLRKYCTIRTFEA
jgi:DNA-directed RNA polymerase subunit RPC12/RpoP